MRSILVALVVSISAGAVAQKKKEIIPRDSITNKYCYTAVSDSIPANKDQLRVRMDKWIKENYDIQKSKYTKLSSDGDTSREDGLYDPEETPRLPAGAFVSAVK